MKIQQKKATKWRLNSYRVPQLLNTVSTQVAVQWWSHHLHLQFLVQTIAEMFQLIKR